MSILCADIIAICTAALESFGPFPVFIGQVFNKTITGNCHETITHVL